MREGLNCAQLPFPTFVVWKGNLMKASERSLDFEPWCKNENRYFNVFDIISIFSRQEGTWRPSKGPRSSLLHFVLFPVRIILISVHSQGICSVRWSDSGHPWHALISSLYKSSCCILVFAAWFGASGCVFEQCWKHCCGFHFTYIYIYIYYICSHL